MKVLTRITAMVILCGPTAVFATSIAPDNRFEFSADTGLSFSVEPCASTDCGLQSTQHADSVSVLWALNDSPASVETRAFAGDGYRFSRFVAFHSYSQICEVEDQAATRSDSCYSDQGNPRAVPEPGTLLLLGSALLLLAVGRGRRRLIPG